MFTKLQNLSNKKAVILRIKKVIKIIKTELVLLNSYQLSLSQFSSKFLTSSSIILESVSSHFLSKRINLAQLVWHPSEWLVSKMRLLLSVVIYFVKFRIYWMYCFNCLECCSRVTCSWRWKNCCRSSCKYELLSWPSICWWRKMQKPYSCFHEYFWESWKILKSWEKNCSRK